MERDGGHFWRQGKLYRRFAPLKSVTDWGKQASRFESVLTSLDPASDFGVCGFRPIACVRPANSVSKARDVVASRVGQQCPCQLASANLFQHVMDHLLGP